MSSTLSNSRAGIPRWGLPPWTIDFQSELRALPDEVEFAVIGGGFTGLAAAAWLQHLQPAKKVALFEASRIGACSSGHTGGMALSETAAGNLPGLGDVLGGFENILRKLQVQCDLTLPGVYEIGRQAILPDSPIHWNDSGALGVTKNVPGGSVDPGKMLSGLARAATERGALLYENAPVEALSADDSPVLTIHGQAIRARHVLIATNAESLELSGLGDRAHPKFTMALATEPLSPEQLQSLGLAERKPFYTTDLPYLWGRIFQQNRVIFGAGLVHLEDWRELLTLNVTEGRAAELLAELEARVRQLHPALTDVRVSHRWGGPILVADNWKPIFRSHAQHRNVIALGAFSGHGVALSVYLGSWAAEAMLASRELPHWEAAPATTAP